MGSPGSPWPPAGRCPQGESAPGPRAQPRRAPRGWRDASSRGESRAGHGDSRRVDELVDLRFLSPTVIALLAGSPPVGMKVRVGLTDTFPVLASRRFFAPAEAI